MSDDIIKSFVKGFVKFQENDQLKRAKETENDFRKMNDATLLWIRDCCTRILTERESLSTSTEGTELTLSGSQSSPKVCLCACHSAKEPWNYHKDTDKFCCDTVGTSERGKPSDS